MSKRADAVRRVRGWLIRGALVAAWALVGWGTLLLLSTVVGLVRDGPGTAVGRLLPGPDSGPWAYLNSASVALALAAWDCGCQFVRDERHQCARDRRRSARGG